MKKNFLKLIPALISCIVIFSAVPMTASAESKNYAAGFNGNTDNCGVYDDKGLFSSEELEELDEIVKETSEELDMYIAIYLSDSALTESNTKTFADTTYDSLFGCDTDGVFYYMDLSEQYSAYDYISTSGKSVVIYQDYIDDMLEDIFRYLPASGEEITSDEIEVGINEICTVLKRYEKNDPGFFDYVHVSETNKYIYVKGGETYVTYDAPPIVTLKTLLIASIIGVIVALLTFFLTKSRYKFKSSCNPSVYVSHDETNFTCRDDRFIRTYTTKTKIESSGGGGSHGGGGGGGSHGGGGGHR